MPCFRAMTVADVAAVYAIERQVQSHPWSEKLFFESIGGGYQSWVMLSDDQQIIGFCILQKVLDEANLLLMATHPQWQKRGLGFQLLNYAVTQLGSHTNVVFLEVRSSNQAAIALYEKSGFHQMDVRKNYYSTATGKEDAIIMALTLNNPFA
jgi:ribosomal-protein-alanine N-acetyltransferase